MTSKIDHTFKRYNRWFVLRLSDTPRGRAKWLARCDCGALKTVDAYNLEKEKSKSCGCLHKESVRKDECASSHSMYQAWSQMKNRCSNKNHKSYKDYGAKGITVCERWKNNFYSFLEDMGERPEGMTLDRIDVEKGYYPENCQWASYSDQMRNRKGFGKSRYKGVQISDSRGIGCTYKNKNGVYIRKSGFVTEEQAAHYYDQLCYEEWGTKFPLNFPHMYE